MGPSMTAGVAAGREANRAAARPLNRHRMRRLLSPSRKTSRAERMPHRCAPSCLKTVHLSQIVSTRSSAGAVFEKSIRADRYILLFQICDISGDVRGSVAARSADTGQDSERGWRADRGRRAAADRNGLSGRKTRRVFGRHRYCFGDPFLDCVTSAELRPPPVASTA